MRKKLSKELLEFLQKVSEEQKASFHILFPVVCDCCKDGEKEAFPYHVEDALGIFWNDLCNDCFEDLGCQYEEDLEAEE